MKDWEQAWRKGFDIPTTEPSGLAVELIAYMPPKGNVLDVGCGKGRDALYFAERGYNVDAIDEVTFSAFPKHNKIHFKQTSIQAFQAYKVYPNHYAGINANRLFQYLPHRDIPRFVKNCSRSLQVGGVLGIDYTLGGGILAQGQFADIRMYHHDPYSVLLLMEEQGLETVSVEKFKGQSRHVGYQREVVARRMIFRKYKKITPQS